MMGTRQNKKNKNLTEQQLQLFSIDVNFGQWLVELFKW